MENASKALVMAAEVVIGIMIISLGVYLFATYSQTSKEIFDKRTEQQIVQFPQEGQIQFRPLGFRLSFFTFGFLKRSDA